MWDPYATPGGTAQAPSLLPQDPYLQSPQLSGLQPVATMRKFLQTAKLDYVFIPGQTPNKFGTNDVDLSASFAIPFLYNQQNPLLVTPGFTFHFLSGPETTPTQPADLPAQLYDAYLDAAWRPQITPWFGGELGFRIGVYSDFRGKTTLEALRYTGSGLAVLTFSPSMQLKAGVVYLDRLRVKLLPAGGIVWTPNSDLRFEILFPNPRIARRVSVMGTTEWWLYGRGEYGGGSWEVIRDTGASAGTTDRVDYNDIRIGGGFEFDKRGGVSGLIEVGAAFSREIMFRETPPARPELFAPTPSLYLRAGLAY